MLQKTYEGQWYITVKIPLLSIFCLHKQLLNITK